MVNIDKEWVQSPRTPPSDYYAVTLRVPRENHFPHVLTHLEIITENHVQLIYRKWKKADVLSTAMKVRAMFYSS